MKNKFGASLYYASDKNIFDALCRNRVNSETIQNMFQARNILVSKKTERKDLASYFSRLPHDFDDHQNIARSLGVIKRRERLASIEVKLSISEDQLEKSIKNIKSNLEQEGDVVHKTQDFDKRSVLNIKYSSLDYRRPEFSQVQIRDGELLIIKIDGGYKIRSTCNAYLNSVRDSFISEMEKQAGGAAVLDRISLFAATDVTKRSEFFHSLMFELPGYSVKDVREVFVYKKRPTSDDSEEDEDEIPEKNYDAVDVHVERVLLRGNGVSRSKQLKDLIKRDPSSTDEPYYMVRVAWTVAEKAGWGNEYEIEARFEDPEACAEFSYMLRSVRKMDVLSGKLNKTKIPPGIGEIDTISKVIEDHAKSLRDKLTK